MEYLSANMFAAKYLILVLIFSPVIALVVLLTPYAFRSSRPKGFPPGPETKPILGNYHLIHKKKPYLLYQEWQKRYGPIMGLKFGPANVVILNDYQDVEALFEKRGAIYSSRPAHFIAQQLIAPDDRHMLFSEYAPAWKSLRRIATTLLSSKQVGDLLPIQNAEVTHTMHDLIVDPARYDAHVRRCTVSIYLAMVYGMRATRADGPLVSAFYEAQDRFTELITPGATPPVDGLTFLRRLPAWLAPWKREAHDVGRRKSRVYKTLLQRVRSRPPGGVDCFLQGMLRDQAASGRDDDHVAWAGGAMMEAASDTTSSTLMSFILGVLTNPGVLVRAQADVDARCGLDRSPGPEDVAHLAYIDACVFETVRWRPAAPEGLPHMLTQHDTYKGYHFPAGTAFFAPAWGLGRSSDFASPERFLPDRWLDNPHGLREAHAGTTRKMTYSFGAGRRICSGQKMAENTLRMAIAKLVWAFDIAPVGDGTVDAHIDTAFEGGLIINPKPFDVVIRPRSQRHVDVIEAEYEALGGFLSRFENVETDV